jgi:hypothetical protein
VLDQIRNESRSATGIPSSSQITWMGSGNANASTRSTSVRPAISSSSSAVMVAMRGSSRSTRRAVNPAETRRRNRVWSGGSALSMWCPIGLPPLPGSWPRGTGRLDRRGSPSAWRASS